MISSALCRIIPGNHKQPPQSTRFQILRVLQLGTQVSVFFLPVPADRSGPATIWLAK